MPEQLRVDGDFGGHQVQPLPSCCDHRGPGAKRLKGILQHAGDWASFSALLKEEITQLHFRHCMTDIYHISLSPFTEYTAQRLLSEL